MSIFKVINRADDNVGTLHDRLNYITRASASRAEYMYGNHVSEWQGYYQMMQVKLSYGQEEGKAYYHYMLNPDAPDYEVLNDRKLFDVGVQIDDLISNFYGNYQVVMAVHFDTDPHLHFIANNIDFMTGERLHLSPMRLGELKLAVNGILNEAGLSPVKMYPYENNGQ